MNLTDKDRIVSDDTDFSLLGCQISHPNFCNVTNTVTTTEDASDLSSGSAFLARRHQWLTSLMLHCNAIHLCSVLLAAHSPPRRPGPPSDEKALGDAT